MFTVKKSLFYIVSELNCFINSF